MLPVPILGAVVTVTLVLVLAGMIPVSFSGNALLAIVLIAILAGIFVYTTLVQELGGAVR